MDPVHVCESLLFTVASLPEGAKGEWAGNCPFPKFWAVEKIVGKFFVETFCPKMQNVRLKSKNLHF